MKQRYNDEIQAVRAIAIILVLISHLSGLFPWEKSRYVEMGKGFYVGVDLFLCVSGYVIAKSLGSGLLETHGDVFWRRVAAFWVRRFYRITPAAWLWIAVPLSAHWALQGLGAHDFSEVIAAILYVANVQVWECAYVTGHCSFLVHYWSLSLEEQFYLLLPFLFLFFRKKIHFVLVGLVVAQFFMPRPVGNFFTAVKTDALMLGVLLALWSKSSVYRIFDPHLRSSRLRYVLAPILSIAIVGLARFEPIPQFIGVVGLVSGLIIWLCSYDKGYFLPPGIFQGILVWIGKRSFAIYLIHPFAYWINLTIFQWLYPAVKFDGTFTFRFVCGAAMILLVLTELTYKLVENPMRRRGAIISERILNPQGPGGEVSRRA